MSAKVMRCAFPLLITILLWAVWSSPLGDISRRFIKLPDISFVYSRSFFVLLFISLWAFSGNLKKLTWSRTAIFSMIAGYFLSVISLIFAEFSVESGVDRILNGFRLAGGGAFLVTQFMVAGIYAGWFYGLLGALGLKLVLNTAIREN